MSFQWTAIAAVLYCEIGLTVLFLVPISSRRWKSIIESGIGRSLGTYANYYFNIFMVLLALCVVDSIREMRKYQTGDKPSASMSTPVGTIEHMNMKMFRAQRNFYIAGFSLFLWFVLRRLVTLLLAEARVQESSEQTQSLLRAEKESLETRVTELTGRLDQVNEATIDDDDRIEDGVRLASLQTAYDKLKSQLEQNQRVEELGENPGGSREQMLLGELDDMRENLARSQQQSTESRREAQEAQEELDRLAAEHQDLQVRE